MRAKAPSSRPDARKLIFSQNSVAQMQSKTRIRRCRQLPKLLATTTANCANVCCCANTILRRSRSLCLFGGRCRRRQANTNTSAAITIITLTANSDNDNDKQTQLCLVNGSAATKQEGTFGGGVVQLANRHSDAPPPRRTAAPLACQPTQLARLRSSRWRRRFA